KAEVVNLKDRLAGLKKADASGNEIADCRDALAKSEKAARDAQAEADAIDAAVYDLKAVNPRAHVVRDTRTPTAIIQSIAEHGRTVAGALAKLSKMLADAKTPEAVAKPMQKTA